MIKENQINVLTAQANDADGDQLSFSVAGTDADDFVISSSGALSFRTAPNFELPTDTDMNNVYNVSVTVSDGSLTASTNATVTVENDREGIVIRQVASGLNDVTSIASSVSSNKLFIAERGGRVHLFDGNSEQITIDRTILNVNTDGEGGLLGLASDPADEDVYWAFVVAQFTVEGDLFNRVTIPGSDITIRRIDRSRTESVSGTGTQFKISHPSDVNYGGGLGIDPINKYLFIGVGDAGTADIAQDPNSKLGKILRFRINPDPYAGAAPAPFLLPVGNNPYFSGGGDPAIYALGVQNPRDLAFDGRFLIFGDSGKNSVEETNAIVSDNDGGNFGWPFFEGTEAFQGSTAASLLRPRSEYIRGSGDRKGTMVQTGRVYPGPVTVLQGKYIFADKGTGKIWAVPTIDLVSGTLLPANQYELLNADFTAQNAIIGNIVAFAINGGDLYFADSNGNLFKLEAG